MCETGWKSDPLSSVQYSTDLPAIITKERGSPPTTSPRGAIKAYQKWSGREEGRARGGRRMNSDGRTLCRNVYIPPPLPRGDNRFQSFPSSDRVYISRSRWLPLQKLKVQKKRPHSDKVENYISTGGKGLFTKKFFGDGSGLKG